ncbi:hypothetical protein WQ57_23525 [Mesobacillus campisalis]|uniref:Uncharacterized protein n=1 Tax=Mesobacillus campisalis TaxID=1408103 RepID=A0A0M2SIX4_9BACI|nr:hypothetical protein WQ57_23525 [Mesobacillus campisalis]
MNNHDIWAAGLLAAFSNVAAAPLPLRMFFLHSDWEDNTCEIILFCCKILLFYMIKETSGTKKERD